MDNPAKIKLSSFETGLLSDPHWILTKNGIMQKAAWVLEETGSHILSYFEKNELILPGSVRNIPPKISKGEKYQGLPWLILDYPRFFEKENVFAIRTMFWWGHYFSTTLHLKGSFKNKWLPKLEKAFQLLSGENFELCVNEDEWQHQLEEGNYLPVAGMTEHSFSEALQKASFIKLAKKTSFSDWESAAGILAGNVEWLAALLGKD
jgi:hypothetical protein